MSIHYGISCDLCRKINFSDRRYKCLICNDFDLCSLCYDKKSNLSFRIHSNKHPMQLILTLNDYEYIYFGFKRTKYSSYSLTCSICNENGFSLDLLIKHINKKHLTIIYSVYCPICFIRQNKLSEHLQKHIEENNIIKTKIIKYNKQSLLENLINNNQNKIINEQRILFIHSLLIDLFK